VNRAFSPRVVLGLVVFGAIAFLATLWMIGQGMTDSGPDNGEAHAAGHGLAGYAALVEMLEKQGYEVTLSRNKAHLTDDSLVILTPTLWTDADDLAEVIERRRYTGPTLVLLPKWYTYQLPSLTKGARKGWTRLVEATEPRFAKGLKNELAMTPKIAGLDGKTPDWSGLGLSGTLPTRGKALGLEGGPWASLVRDSQGRDLVAYADDHGCYPVLDDAAGFDNAADAECEKDKWNVTVVFEPDLFNNWGMADRNRALLASRVVELAREGQDIPIEFDLTLAGLGGAKNLLTLAFAPPFLAATLCLLIALVVVGWRGFGRFGPAVAEDRAIAFGKVRLAANAGGFIRRSGRLHLLGPPYAAMAARRIARTLGLRGADPAAIDAAIARRDPAAPAFSDLARRLETARGPNATLRAAHALHTLEKDVTP
jgi:hypothetical protein